MARCLWAPALLALVAATLTAAQSPAATDLLRVPPTLSRALSSAPGCGGDAIEGLMDGCILEDVIKTGEVHEYSFVVPHRGAERPFSVLITSKSVGGRVDMIAIGPDAIYQENTIFRLVGSIQGHTAMSETYIRIHGQQLKPGTWKIRVFGRSSDRKATIYTLRIQTPLTATRLVAPEKTALAALVSQCCDVRRSIKMGAPNIDLCASVLPAAAAVKTDSTTDLCQVGPFMCTPEGRLQKLMLGGAWLNCPAFPEALSAFEGLHTLEFQVATFGGDTFADAAKVLAPLTGLERIYFRSTDLTGEVPCELVAGKPNLQILDLSDSLASGQLPACILGSATLEELYLTRTLMTGPLPDKIPFNSKLRVLYAWNVHPDTGKPWTKGAFTGPLPSSLSNAASMTNLVLPFHQLTGELPALPEMLDWLDLKGNRITTIPASIPPNLRILDLSENGMAGSLPNLKDAALAWVNLTSNQLQGTLPETWGNPANTLAVLCLANNSFSGDLDGTNWSIEFLEMLDLSNNNLGGVLAPELATLEWLSFLNLANNEIGGTLDEFAGALPNVARRRLASRRRRLLSAREYNGAALLGARGRAARRLSQQQQHQQQQQQAADAASQQVATVSAAPAPAGGARGLPTQGDPELSDVLNSNLNVIGMYTGSKITFLDFSNNRLEGSIPDSLSRLGVFQWVQDSTPDQQLFHYLFLDNNDIWSEIPGFMLDAIAIPAELNKCRCNVYLDLTNTTRFCPTASTVASLAPGSLQALMSPNAPDLSCLRSDFSLVTLKQYLASPGAASTSIPPAPPSRGAVREAKPRPAAPDAAPQRQGGGGGGGKLSGGAVAGVVIGVLAALGIMAAVGFFVLKPMVQERRATSFFKTSELDHHPQIQVNSQAAAEAGWGRGVPAGGQ